jgi:hypothetical protein
MAATFELISTPRREVAPWSHRAGRSGNEEKFSMVEQDYADWISSLSKGEALFKKHVYCVLSGSRWCPPEPAGYFRWTKRGPDPI